MAHIVTIPCIILKAVIQIDHSVCPCKLSMNASLPASVHSAWYTDMIKKKKERKKEKNKKKKRKERKRKKKKKTIWF